MEYTIKTYYKIYGLDDEHLAKQQSLLSDDESRVVLREVSAKIFDTVEQALFYIREKKMTYRDFTILPIYYLN